MEHYNPPREPQAKDYPVLSREEFQYLHDIWREEYTDYRITWNASKGNDKDK